LLTRNKNKKWKDSGSVWIKTIFIGGYKKIKDKISEIKFSEVWAESLI
jgi:hypothetical protein